MRQRSHGDAHGHLRSARQVSDAKYPPITIEIPDWDTGEVRRVVLSFSTMTMADAFSWERQLRYFDAVIHQWFALFRNVVERDAEATGYAVKKDERMRGAI